MSEDKREENIQGNINKDPEIKEQDVAVAKAGQAVQARSQEDEAQYKAGQAQYKADQAQYQADQAPNKAVQADQAQYQAQGAGQSQIPYSDVVAAQGSQLPYQDLGAPKISQDYYDKKKSVERKNMMAAGAIIRFLAYVLDAVLIKAITTIFLRTIFVIAGWSIIGHGLTPYNILSKVIYLAYFFLMTYFNNGETLGKMIFGLKVCSSVNDGKPDFLQVLTREVAMRYIQDKFFILYALIPFMSMKQSLGDFMADTYVKRIVREDAFIAGMQYRNMLKHSAEEGKL